MSHRDGIRPIYNEVMNLNLNFCGFMNGTESNLMMRLLLETVKDTAPKGFFHPCPFYKDFVAYNVSLVELPVLVQFLLGRYRTVMRFSDRKDSNIFTAFFEFELTTK